VQDRVEAVTELASISLFVSRQGAGGGIPRPYGNRLGFWGNAPIEDAS
jgi:hypothetical protein